MQAEKQFKKELYKLFDDRIHRLVADIGKRKVGKPPKVNRQKVTKSIEKLQCLASKSIAVDIAKNEFDRLVEKKKQWHLRNKGWGIKQKKKSFNLWFAKHIPYDNCIYVFWSNRKSNRVCVYVGKTKNGKGRPQNHFDKKWFTSVTRIDIYSVANVSQVLKLECLAIHRFEPKKNSNRPAKRRWHKKCPVCKVHKRIHDEVRNIFSLKKK